MLIFYGVKYYGKTNAFVKHGTCSQCGRPGRLSSYDSAAFFTIYWLPLIPLGSKRIMDSCPHCKRHKEIGLRKFNTLKKKTLLAALTDLKHNLSNSDKAVEALNNLVAYNDFDQFKEIAPLIIKQHKQNPDVLHKVGDAYEYIGDFKSAVQCRADAVRADNSIENQTKLGLGLLHMNRPKEARPYLEQIISRNDTQNIPALYFLVESYRDKGLHTEALEILHQIETMEPEVQNDENHKELILSSKARLDTADEVPSSYLNAPRGIEPQRGGVPLWVPYALPMALFCLIVGSYLFSAVSKGMARDMILVSGAPIAYTAMVNDKTFQLKPYEYKHVTLPEGELAIQITGTALPIPQQTVVCRSPFFSRPFDSKVTVINPDGLGILIKNKVAYTTYTSSEDDSSYTLYYSKVLHEFSDIDFPFEDLPDNIQMNSNVKKEYRTNLTNYIPESSSHLFNVLTEHMQKKDMIQYLEKYVALTPESAESPIVLWLLSGMADPDRFLAFVKQGLGIEKVMVEWHRVYQSMMEIHNPDYDLLGEYTAYHKKNPSNPYLTYLLGRVTLDSKSADTLYLQAESLGKPIGLGYHAAAYHNLCSGHYDKSLELAEKAAAVQTNNNSYFQRTLEKSHMALKHFDSLLESVREERRLDDTDKLLASREIKLLMLKNLRKEAERVKTEYLETLKKQVPEEDLTPVQNDFEALISYLGKDYKRYATVVEASSDRFGPVYSALQKNDAAHAAELLDTLGNIKVEIYLLTYCVAKVNGNNELADQMLAKGIDVMRSGGSDKRCAAKMLSGDINEIKSHLEDVCILPEDKRILALSLGLAFPTVEDYCFRIAQKFNFDRDFPYQTINSIVSRKI